jgi:hypothetical protein
VTTSRRLRSLVAACLVLAFVACTHLGGTPTEQAAIREQLRLRGAAVTVFGGGDVLVHFPLGRLETEWRRQGVLNFRCGLGIDEYLIPDDHSLPMTDSDLVYLDRVRRLSRVNFGGTQVTKAAMDAFRQRHRNVSVEETDE